MLGGAVPHTSNWWLASHAESQWSSHAQACAEKSPLLGWALDGHPIFGPYNPDNGKLVVTAGANGECECAANQLDECNGMVLENGAYAYFLTQTFPFVPPCLMGEVHTDAFKDTWLKDNQVAQCLFEGTHLLAGQTICNDVTDCQCNAGWVRAWTGACVLCGEGYWCPGGNETNQCPGNTSSATGSSAQTDCIPWQGPQTSKVPISTPDGPGPPGGGSGGGGMGMSGG
eukprot:2516063-Rhodomonas_salina.1